MKNKFKFPCRYAQEVVYLYSNKITFKQIIMNVNEVYELRRQGKIEDAYSVIRNIYATDKSEAATKAMFWTAVDVLEIRVKEGRTEEARKIYLALERLLCKYADNNGWMENVLKECKKLLQNSNRKQEHNDDKAEHLQSGIWGEELAAAYLREKGYVILERNWHSGHRDIDIIAQRNDCTVFVEVKTRSNREYREPEEAINYEKQKNLLRSINHYLNYRHLKAPWRFDVITIIGKPYGNTPEINHIENFNLNNL